jgi:hypothetical protein
MIESTHPFTLRRLPKRSETPEELDERIAELLAEGLYAYLMRHGLLKQPDTASMLARIETLRRTRPNYEAL